MEYRRIRIVRVGDSPIIDFAAKELNRYLKAADATIVIDELKKKEFAGSEETITLKVCPKLPEVLGVEDAKLDDGYLIDITNDHGIIKGTNERSVLLGVYRFLKEMGYAFTRPGKDGERIPACVPAEYKVYVKEKAAYRHRGVCIEGADTYQNIWDIVDFIPKSGMNEYFIQFWVPGTFFERWYFHASNPLLKPENITREDVEGFIASLEEEIARRGICLHKTGHGWTCEPFGIEGTTWDNDRVYNLSEESKSFLAEVEGKRELWGNVPLNTNLCYSNPEVRHRIATAIRDYCQRNPQCDVIHFWLADGTNNHCECENCRKKRPSDWYIDMLNEVDAELTKANNPTRIVFLIYVDLLWEPESSRLNNPDRFILMFAPITRYYGVNYSDSGKYEGELPPYMRNHLQMPADLSENLARLSKWQDQFKGDSFIFDYHLQWAYAADPGYELVSRNLFEDMCYLKEMGLNGNVSCQVQRVYFPSGLAFRGLASALWNGTGNFDELAEDYYREVYGEKGPAVRAYLKKISDNFTTYKYYKRTKLASKEEETEVSRPFGSRYLTDHAQLLKDVDEFLPVIEEGIAKAKGTNEGKDWELLKLHADYVKNLGEAIHLVDEGEDPKEAIQKTIDLLNENEMMAQSVMDGDNFVRLLTNRFQGSF